MILFSSIPCIVLSAPEQHGDQENREEDHGDQDSHEEDHDDENNHEDVNDDYIPYCFYMMHCVYYHEEGKLLFF